MKTSSVIACSLLAALAGCSSGSDVAPPGAIAPIAYGTPVVFDFEGDDTGRPPQGWRVEGTRSGTGGSGAALATWAVEGDGSAPSGSQVLAVTVADHGEQDTFNLCWNEDVSFGDGRLRVAVKAEAGDVDQGGGPMWRVAGHDDYLVCRINPLEQNFRVYRVHGGVRTQLDSELIDIEADSWHVIEVVQAGRHITCTLDGDVRLQAEDDLVTAPGGVGLWTKADARTAFDDLRVEAARP